MSDSASVQELLERGGEAWRRGQTMEAFEAFATGFRNYPDDLETQTRLVLFMLTTLASGHNSVGETERAIQIWNGFLQVQPENASISRLLGLALMRMGDFNQAKPHLVRAFHGAAAQDRDLLLDEAGAIARTSRGIPQAMSQRLFHLECLVREIPAAGTAFRDIAAAELSSGTPVLIAGMHRSGTSMVTRVAAQLGVHLGPDNQLVSAGADNPEGFFENWPIIQLNQDLLSHQGGSWDAPPRNSVHAPSDPAMATMKSRGMLIAAGIAANRGDAPAWGWKDPRNSLLVPFWLDIVPNARLIVVFRDPGAVADSLLRRGGNHTREFGLRLWHDYYQSIFESADMASTLFVEYEAFFESPVAQAARIAAHLGLAMTEDSAATTSSQVNRALRHDAGTDNWRASGLAREITPTYQRLCTLAK